MIIVTNKYKKSSRINPQTYTKNIMRPNLLGNPYKIGRDGTREQVIDLYFTWLKNQYYLPNSKIKEKLISLASLHRAGYTIYLECCCTPKPCHGDILKTVIENISNNHENS